MISNDVIKIKMNNIRDIRAEAIRIADNSHRAVVLGVCGSMIMKLKKHDAYCRCEYCRVLDTYITVKKCKSRFYRRLEFMYDSAAANDNMPRILEFRSDYDKLKREVKDLRSQKEGIKREAAIEMML